MGLCITRWYSNRFNKTIILSSFEYSSHQNQISQNKTVSSIFQNQTEFHTKEEFEYSLKLNIVSHNKVV